MANNSQGIYDFFKVFNFWLGLFSKIVGKTRHKFVVAGFWFRNWRQAFYY